MPALLVAIVFFMLTLFDRQLWAWFRLDSVEFARAQRRDWYMLLREAGYLPTWMFVAACFILADFTHARQTRRTHGHVPLRSRVGLLAMPRPESRGVIILLCAGLGGLAAEILMVAVRRWRPGETGIYNFWISSGDTNFPGFGFVSSHVGVAFGATFGIARLFPGTLLPLSVLATGCAVSRMLAGAHFATDCFGAAVVSYLVVNGLFRLPVIADALDASDARRLAP
jgi:membrane-associated phospholipid phosphatase